jgi:predicted dehydrogenase
MQEVELLGFDIDPARAAGFAESTGAAALSSLEQLISAADVVDICVPTHLHFDIAMQSLKAGKPTLCEKPLARNVSDCAKLVEESIRLGVPLMPAQVVRYFPEFRRAHELVKNGAVGDASAIRTRRGGAFPSKGAGNWFDDFEASGGVIMDLAIHDLDWIRWTFGEVARVYAGSLTFSGHRNLDYALITMTLDSGALAHTEATWADPAGFRVAFEISGSKGFIEHDSRNSASLRTSRADGSQPESPMLPTDDPYYLQIAGFLDAVRAGTAPPVSPEDGLMAVALGSAAIESARTGRAIKPSRG